jgi:hypothetical protein
MPGSAKGDQPTEFLVVAIPEKANAGANLRLLGIAADQTAAEQMVNELDAGTLGRIAVLERKGLFVRRPAVQTTPLGDAIASQERGA